MDNKLPFIATHDATVKKELLQAGFTLIEENNGRYVFLNDKKMSFDKDGKVYFTNRLFL